MRIVHLCLSCFYIDNHFYQENILVREHVNFGHDVLVIASTENFDANKKITYVKPGEYIGSDNARVIRLPYRLWPHFLAKKLRVHAGLDRLLEGFAPDVIMFHGTCGWELHTAASYVRRHSGVKFFIDSHEDWNNSARTLLSREFLHRRYYGPVLRSAIGPCEAILCVSTEAIDFVADLYKIERSMLELFPLGCIPIHDDEYVLRRKRGRAVLDAKPENRILIQSGKQTARKKLIEALKAFKDASTDNTLFVIAGALSDDIREQSLQLIESDTRIRFLGWCDTETLTDLLCAADVYVQPGTQSATMQHSMGCRCALLIDDAPAHLYYKCGNGWFVRNQNDLQDAIRAVGVADIELMAKNSYEFARSYLDYRKLAQRVTG